MMKKKPQNNDGKSVTFRCNGRLKRGLEKRAKAEERKVSSLCRVLLKKEILGDTIATS